MLNLSYGTDGTQAYTSTRWPTPSRPPGGHGIVVVVAAGNDGTRHRTADQPGLDPYVIAVGAADLHGTAGPQDDTVADFSSRGNRPAAPTSSPPAARSSASATRARSTSRTPARSSPTAPGARFFRGSGTSQAAAVVSGAAALLLQHARP